MKMYEYRVFLPDKKTVLFLDKKPRDLKPPYMLDCYKWGRLIYMERDGYKKRVH